MLFTWDTTFQSNWQVSLLCSCSDISHIQMWFTKSHWHFCTAEMHFTEKYMHRAVVTLNQIFTKPTHALPAWSYLILFIKANIWNAKCFLKQLNKMGTFSALLAICAGNSPVTDEFPTQRPVMQSFDVFFDLWLNKQFSKQSWGWWFGMPSHPFWHHSNAVTCSVP